MVWDLINWGATAVMGSGGSRLLLGVVIGVVGTLSVEGLLFLFVWLNR